VGWQSLEGMIEVCNGGAPVGYTTQRVCSGYANSTVHRIIHDSVLLNLVARVQRGDLAMTCSTPARVGADS
jgi:hypothetical protein